MVMGIRWLVFFISAAMMCALLLAYVSYVSVFEPGMGLLVQGIVTVSPNITSYDVRLATFGPRPPQFGGHSSIEGPVAAVNSSMCGENPLVPGSLNGTIAVVRRGDCPFAEKILNLQSAGAAAVIVGNNGPGGLFTMFGTGPAALVEIPAVSIGYRDWYELDKNSGMWNVSIWSHPEEFQVFDGLLMLVARPLMLLALLSTFFSISLFNEHARKLKWNSIVSDLPVHCWDGHAQIYHCTECIICLDDFEMGTEVMTLPCKHEFHAECIERWLLRQRKGECPICKRLVSEPTERTPLLLN